MKIKYHKIINLKSERNKNMDINKIKKELIKQKESKFKGNIYHYSQVNFSYNSNKRMA